MRPASAHHFDEAHRSDPAAALQGAPLDVVRILPAHQPRSAVAAEQVGFDLRLSGHTHDSQFWPWKKPSSPRLTCVSSYLNNSNFGGGK